MDFSTPLMIDGCTLSFGVRGMDGFFESLPSLDTEKYEYILLKCREERNNYVYGVRLSGW